MTDRLTKTSICNVIFLDIVGFSQKTVAEQTACKARFNMLINGSVMDIAQPDCIVLDTGDGAAISLTGAPEEALFVAMRIRDRILSTNLSPDGQLQARIGIHLGPVRVVKDVKGNPNIIGEGINVAQHVMSFALPNTILASRLYFEAVSRSGSDITGMFSYFGSKTDNPLQGQEIYLVSPGEQADPALPSIQNGYAAEKKSTPTRHYWKYGIAATAAAIFLTASLMVSQGSTSTQTLNLKPTLQATRTEVALEEEKKKTPTKMQLNHREKEAPQNRRLSSSDILCTDAQRMMHQCS